MAIWIIPLAVLALIVIGWFAVNAAGAKRISERQGGDPERAFEDSEDPVPSTHLIPDDQRPLGDTPEAHDEVNPHDIPLDNPGRHAAEERVGGEDGQTSGNVEGAPGGAGASSARAECPQLLGAPLDPPPERVEVLRRDQRSGVL